MIARASLVTKLREIGYTFERQGDRVCLWRLKGGTHVATVPRSDEMAIDTVRSTLRQCGQSADAIEKFLAECTKVPTPKKKKK